MLTIFSDPAGITGRRRVALNTQQTLFEQLRAAMPQGAGDAELRINGETVRDPATDARLDVPPGAGDEVVVVQRPAGFDPLTLTVTGGAMAPAVLAGSYRDPFGTTTTVASGVAIPLKGKPKGSAALKLP